MKIAVLEVQGELVTFDCAAGRGQARWHGPLPSRGLVTHVELDLELAGVALAASTGRPDSRGTEPARTPSLSLVGDAVRAVALVEAVDDDGVVVLRLSPDAICLVNASSATVGALVEVLLPPSALGLWPIGL